MRPRPEPLIRGAGPLGLRKKLRHVRHEGARNLDASAFPVGMCTRTVLAKAEVVLWRTAAEAFRLEVARSFVSYVAEFLAEAERVNTSDQALGSRSQLERFS